jgi:hypothetical protein
MFANFHRHRDPAFRRWLSEKPVGYASDDQNLRSYVKA